MELKELVRKIVAKTVDLDGHCMFGTVEQTKSDLTALRGLLYEGIDEEVSAEADAPAEPEEKPTGECHADQTHAHNLQPEITDRIGVKE